MSQFLYYDCFSDWFFTLYELETAYNFQIVNEEGGSQEGVGSSVLLLMVRDAYANYVVQTAIDVVPEGNEKRMLLDELKAHEVQLVSAIFYIHLTQVIITPPFIVIY